MFFLHPSPSSYHHHPSTSTFYVHVYICRHQKQVHNLSRRALRFVVILLIRNLMSVFIIYRQTFFFETFISICWFSLNSQNPGADGLFKLRPKATPNTPMKNPGVFPSVPIPSATSTATVRAGHPTRRAARMSIASKRINVPEENGGLIQPYGEYDVKPFSFEHDRAYFGSPQLEARAAVLTNPLGHRRTISNDNGRLIITSKFT